MSRLRHAIQARLAGAVDLPPATLERLADVESLCLAPRLLATPIDRPIYVAGLARAGTTITLELLAAHHHVATQCYRDLLMPFLPFAWDRWGPANPMHMPDRPTERIHRDGIYVVQTSPEAVEEPLWKHFFPFLHDESRCNALGAAHSHPRFERFYRRHARKILLRARRSRLVVKNNYDLARMPYLSALLPDARFVLLVREPVAHVASLMKQDALFAEAGCDNPAFDAMSERLGHHEFGRRKVAVHLGDASEVRAIREAWEAGRPHEGWARHWRASYRHALTRLAEAPHLARSALWIRYEDLVGRSGETIDRILEHTGLEPTGFAKTREEFVERLRPPTYYRPALTDAQRSEILEITRDVHETFDYGGAT